MKRALFLAGLMSLATTPAAAWGPTGHRVTGALAEARLTPAARAQVAALLGPETLAEASTWPDEMRSNPAEFWQSTANPFHFVTVPDGQTYSQAGAPPQGDGRTALEAFTATLRDPAAPLDERRLALRFIVHIIGDLHQPLHAGDGTDRGGNDVTVVFFDEPTNLHWVWDVGLIQHQALSYSEMAEWLDAKITPADESAWGRSEPEDWIGESVALREGLYPADAALSWDYAYAHTPTVKLRLQQAGVRIAAYLNALWAQEKKGRRPWGRRQFTGDERERVRSGT